MTQQIGSTAARVGVAAALAVSQLGGCASPGDTVVFVTKTSLGIDVESTPAGASIAYDRVEGYVGPRFDGGTTAPVAGSIATNGKLLDRQIRQVYATGHAAKRVTGATTASGPNEDFSGDKKVMFFGTSTVLGVKLAFAPTGLVDSFTLGYKRKELSVIPIAKTGLPSVLATLDTSVQASTQTDAGLQLEQFFATGAAADQLASLGGIQAAFTGRATSALAQYREQQTEQARLALETLVCFSRMDDLKLPEVWTNAEALSLFDDKGIVPRLRVATPRDGRALYTREMSLLDPKSETKTGLMTGHRVLVCDLAK